MNILYLGDIHKVSGQDNLHTRYGLGELRPTKSLKRTRFFGREHVAL